MAGQPIAADSVMVCAGCRFYRPLNDGASECRRGPPVVILDQPGWLTVAADSPGCGEFIGVAPRPGDNPDAPP